MSTFSSLMPLIGAGVGLAVAGPPGAMVGGQVGTMVGQVGDSISQSAKAKKKKPNPNDDMRLAYLEEVKKRLRDAESGRTYKPLVDEVKQNAATYMAGIGTVSGGNAGAYMSGIGKVQSGTNSALNQINTQRMADVKFFEGLQNSLVDNIAKRKADIEMYDWVMALSQKAADKSAANKNIQEFLANPESMQMLSKLFTKK